MEVLFQEFLFAAFFFFFTLAFTSFQRKEARMTELNLFKPLIKVLEWKQRTLKVKSLICSKQLISSIL